jgi:hypothetical protein
MKRLLLPLLALAAVGCSSPLPSASGRRCRWYATAVEVDGAVRTYTFDAASREYKWGRNRCAEAGLTYASLSDFIEEASVPNRPRLSGTFIFNYCGMLISSGSTTATYNYDGEGRLVRVDGASQWGYSTAPSRSVTHYSAWDSRGRPLAGTASEGGQPSSFSIVYDDATRSMTTLYEDGRESQVQQDAFGNTIRAGDVAYTVIAMEQVCL